jgi:AraC family transcriptional regulator, arabinose operon regulatory protein
MDPIAGHLYDPAVAPSETASPPPGVLMTGHFDERPGYGAYRPRGAGSWLVTYTVAGTGLYRQPPALELRAEPGDLILLHPRALHDYSVPPGGAWEFFWAHFQPRVDWLSWWRLPEIGQGLFRVRLTAPDTRRRAGGAFARLHRDASTSSRALPGIDLQRELALNALEEVMLLAARETALAGTPDLDARVRQVLDRIVGDLGAEHRIEALAAEVSLSPSRLSHLFKRELGDSIINLILTTRLQRAAQLLEFTPRSIAAISDELGFGSPFYFSRQFRRRFGISPSAYRDRSGPVDTRSPINH